LIVPKSRSAKTVLGAALAFGAIAVAFQLGVWQGFVQLLAAMAAVELGRLVRNKSRAGA
jgi:hypothetical protein